MMLPLPPFAKEPNSFCGLVPFVWLIEVFFQKTVQENRLDAPILGTIRSVPASKDAKKLGEALPIDRKTVSPNGAAPRPRFNRHDLGLGVIFGQLGHFGLLAESAIGVDAASLIDSKRLSIVSARSI